MLNTHDFDESELLSIITEHNIEYSTNSNGFFVNLSLLDDTIIDKLYDKVLSMNKVPPLSDHRIGESIPVQQRSVPTQRPKETLHMTKADTLLLSLSTTTLTI
jgi:hypothetical protein